MNYIVVSTVHNIVQTRGYSSVHDEDNAYFQNQSSAGRHRKENHRPVRFRIFNMQSTLLLSFLFSTKKK